MPAIPSPTAEVQCMGELKSISSCNSPPCPCALHLLPVHCRLVPHFWWKANQDVTLASDGRYHACWNNPTGKCVTDSCCILDEMDVIYTEDRCPYNVPGRRAEQEQRSINGTTINAAKTVNPGPSAAADGRKLQQASEEAVSTASYCSNEQHSAPTTWVRLKSSGAPSTLPTRPQGSDGRKMVSHLARPGLGELASCRPESCL